jgi:hypothetical protein
MMCLIEEFGFEKEKLLSSSDVSLPFNVPQILILTHHSWSRIGKDLELDKGCHMETSCLKIEA